MQAGEKIAAQRGRALDEAYATALRAAVQRRMWFRRSAESPTLAQVECMSCGWPEGAGFDVSIERYAKAPHGCGACEHRANLALHAEEKQRGRAQG